MSYKFDNIDNIDNIVKLSWKQIFKEYDLLYPKYSINNILNNCYNNNNIINVFPKYENCFRCFNYFEFNETKVVILGQDPYHNDDQACGLAFGIENNKIPPSLKNITKELKSSLNIEFKDNDYSLEKWAKQGILLLNTGLTVEKNKPGSHIKIWNNFIKFIIDKLSKSTNSIVFLCWGAYAHKILQNINNPRHCLIVTSHPSPLSCNKKYKSYPSFNGSKCFICVNHILEENGLIKIEW